MRRFMLNGRLVAAIIISIAAAAPALAVDNIESSDAPDLTSVQAKISAKDYAGALTELRGIAETVRARPAVVGHVQLDVQEEFLEP